MVPRCGVLSAVASLTLATLPGGVGQHSGTSLVTQSPSSQPEQSDGRVTDPKLIAELEALDAVVAEVVDLRANFEQTKKTPLLRKPLVSSGTVLVKGKTIRWDTLKPHAGVLHVTNDAIRVYYPEQAVVEVFTVDEGLRRLTASPLPRLAQIRDEFTIASYSPSSLDPSATPETHLAIALTPRDERVRTHVREVRVLLNRKRAFAERIELAGPEGETTSIRFENVELNAKVTDGEIALDLPETVRVSYPLGRTKPKESR